MTVISGVQGKDNDWKEAQERFLKLWQYSVKLD